MVLQVVTARQYNPIFIVPIFCNLHITLLHKFKSVLWLKNKTHQPPTKTTADHIFFSERFALQRFWPRNYTLAYFNPIVSVQSENLCDHSTTVIRIVSDVFPSPCVADFVAAIALLAISIAGI